MKKKTLTRILLIGCLGGLILCYVGGGITMRDYQPLSDYYRGVMIGLVGL